MATVPVQVTWVSGQVVSASQLNANVRDAVNFLLNPPSAAVRQTNPQTLTTSTTTSILMDAEDRDNDGMHSTSTNTSRLTAQTPGWYLGTGGVTYLGNATGARFIFYRVNGSTMPTGGNQPVAVASPTSRVVGSTYNFFLNVGDYLEIAGNQNTGANLATSNANGEQPYLYATWNGSN